MSFGDVVKVLILPGLIALALYALITHALIPLYRSHRARYAQYLPVQTITSTSTTLRDRFTDAVARFALPSHMRWRRELADARRGSGSGDELYFGEEEGESMVGFDYLAVERRVRGGEVMDSQRRLSRDLEEGFKDESEDEEEEDARVNQRRRG